MPFSHHSHSGNFASMLVECLRMLFCLLSKEFLVYGLTEHVPVTEHWTWYPEEVWGFLECIPPLHLILPRATG